MPEGRWLTPMATTAADDPIRAEVERVLRAFVDATLAAPSDAARGVRRCVRRRTAAARSAVMRPVKLATSLFDLVGRRPAAPATVTPGAAVVETSATDAPPTSVSTDVAPPIEDDVDLPIEEYESMAASHVVARLDGLSPGELRAVRRFEVAHRGRRTVLGKIDQLLDA